MQERGSARGARLNLRHFQYYVFNIINTVDTEELMSVVELRGLFIK